MQRRALASLAATFFSSVAALAAAQGVLLPSTSAHVVAHAPVETARQSLIARDPSLAQIELDARTTFALPDGRKVVRFAQLHDGVEVIDRGATVLLDASGAATSLAAARLVRTGLPSVQPALSRAAAARIASHVAATTLRAKDGRLGWLPSGDSARLVWTFHRGPQGIPFAPAIAIDAADGSVVLAYSALSFDRLATVHELNPVTTPTPTQVTLDELAPGATQLSSERMRVSNCVDEGTLVRGKFPIHACVTKQLAAANAQGDFTQKYAGDADPEDAYAEVAMFYHAAKAYAYFTELGMPELEAKPLELVVNLRLPVGFASFDWNKMRDPSLPLEPYNNAFFATQNPFFGAFGPEGPSLWFGQGTLTDFAYDGDVVYHEFGHAMVDRTAKLVHYWRLDGQGASVFPGAMNEGIADYFSSAITGDAKVGEYAAQNFVQLGGAAIRDLDNDHRCPTQLSGEVHVDSTLFSGALWQVRQALPSADRGVFDGAVLTALAVAPSGDLSFDEMAELIQAAVKESELGGSAAIAFEAELTARGVLPACSRLLEYSGTPVLGPEARLNYSFTSPGTYSVTLDEDTPFVPGLVQVHAKLTPGTKLLTVSMQDVSIETQAWIDGDPYEPALLVRFDATPIEFSYEDELAASNAGEPIPLGALRMADVDVPNGAKDIHVMVVNLGDLDGRYTALTIKPKVPTSGAGGSAGSAGTAGNAGVGGADGGLQADPNGGLAPAGGCACRTEAGSSSSRALALAFLALAALARRRFTRRGPARPGFRP